MFRGAIRGRVVLEVGGSRGRMVVEAGWYRRGRMEEG